MKKSTIATLDDVYKEVKFVRKRVLEIEKHLLDIDNIMTESDFLALQSFHKEKNTGKLISHDDLKKEFGL